MRNIILNTWLLIVIMVVVSVSSIYFSIINQDYSFFSRSGSIVTMLGILLTVKHSILSESRGVTSILMEKNHYCVYMPQEDSQEYQNALRKSQLIMLDEYLGISLTIIGTVIWGYGDLLS